MTMDTAIITILLHTYRQHLGMSYVYGIEDTLESTDPNRARWIGWEAVAFGHWFADRPADYDMAALRRAWRDYNNRVSLVKAKSE